jgi:amino acid transporter
MNSLLKDRISPKKAAIRQEQEETIPPKFSTFAGVFTPSILGILGVILFMRANFVLGYSGLWGALIILGLAKTITITTGLSISAIATNIDVKGGGAYYLISRTLGPEFGATIGLTLFFAQTLAIPFYVIGFSESLVRIFPIMQPYFLHISIFTLIALFILTFKGTDWAIKTQYIIMTILGLSILVFLLGALLKFNPEILQSNKMPRYDQNYSFWKLFAIYFPAATGFLAGVNMSGDLKNPSRSIPIGTMSSMAVAGLIYLVQFILCAGAIQREQLINAPFHSLISISPFYTGFLVVIGVFCATLSSAIGSFLGAPRVLQSLGKDRLLKPANFFSKLSKSGEPRRALILSFLISLVTIISAGNSGSAAALNIVASMVTMLFLWTYGIINLAAFVETFSRNPSFRPRFKYFHWLPALAGAIASLVVSLLIDALAAFTAVIFIGLLFTYVRKNIMEASFGDARRGFYYTQVRNNLLTLSNLPLHPKNWRPTIVVLSGNPSRRLTLVKCADWLGSGRGIVILVNMILGDLDKIAISRKDHLDTLNQFIQLHRIKAFAEVLVTNDFDNGLIHFLQSISIGPIKPNLAIFGWSSDPQRVKSFFDSIRIAKQLQMSTVLIRDGGLPEKTAGRKKPRIDIWWRGRRNGSLMVILAYLLSINAEWTGSQIRILRAIRNSADAEETRSELESLVENARIKAIVKIIVSQQDFSSILRENSSDASIIFMGFDIPEPSEILAFQSSVDKLLKEMPTTMLISSTGDADLLS